MNQIARSIYGLLLNALLPGMYRAVCSIFILSNSVYFKKELGFIVCNYNRQSMMEVYTFLLLICAWPMHPCITIYRVKIKGNN